MMDSYSHTRTGRIKSDKGKGHYIQITRLDYNINLSVAIPGFISCLGAIGRTDLAVANSAVGCFMLDRSHRTIWGEYGACEKYYKTQEDGETSLYSYSLTTTLILTLKQ